MNKNKKGQTETAKHFQQHGFLNLRQNTISGWKKDEARIREEAKDMTQLSFKRAHRVEQPEMEASL